MPSWLKKKKMNPQKKQNWSLWRWEKMRDNRKKGGNEENDSGSPGWMTTFGDMMTLLLVFFVMMYSMSSLDVDRFMGFISSFQSQMGVLDGGETVTDEDMMARGSRGEDFNVARNNLQMVQEQLEEFIEERNLEDDVEMGLTDRGLTVSVTGEVLYEIGRAEIQSEGAVLLNEIIKNIEEIPNEIMVEGHTDDWPIKTDEFPSNWELSTARATNVVRYFIENTDIDPARFSAAGYSEYRPVASNDNATNRAENRRVEIVVLNSILPKDMEELEEIDRDDLEETGGEAPGEAGQ
ncbi:MAG: flagellar motor protein MotB [Halanaerobiaceae bacterium]